MKKKYKLNYTHFLSSLFGNYIIIYLCSSFFALILFIIIYFQYGIFNPYFFIIFLLMLIACIFIIKTKYKLKSTKKYAQRINRLIEGWNKIMQHPKIIPRLILNYILGLIINIIRIQIIFLSLNININIFKSTYLAIINILGSFINITPGSLGVSEALYAISSNTLGLSVAEGVMAALVLRILNSTTLLVLGPIANYKLLKDLKQKSSDDTSQAQLQPADE